MRSRARMAVFLTAALCIISVPLAATEEPITVTQIASTPIPQPLDSSVVLVEHFIAPNHTSDPPSSNDVLYFSWWKWSDETNSNWPDDDAKARLGELGLESNTTFLFNEEVGDGKTFEEGIALGQDHSRTGDVIELNGEIELVTDLNDAWSIRVPFEMTPLANLSSSTVMYMFITEDSAVDHHGRSAEHLIRDMQPEVSFSNQAGNTTASEWVISSEHLLAAGIDLESNPYGWHITFALFGEAEGDDTNRLLALYSTPLPSRWSSSSIGDFALPLFLLLLSGVLASGVISNAYRREKGMPRLNAEWVEGDLPIIHLTFSSGDQPVDLKSCEVDKPWQIKGGFKKKKLPTNGSYECSIRLKEWHASDCSVSIALEVEELGSWTQYLRLSSPYISPVEDGRSVEAPQ